MKMKMETTMKKVKEKEKRPRLHLGQVRQVLRAANIRVLTTSQRLNWPEKALAFTCCRRRRRRQINIGSLVVDSDCSECAAAVDILAAAVAVE